MTEVSARNFGLLIAYLIPGFITVLSLAGTIPSFASWLATSADASPTVGGVLYITLASLAAGMVVSCTRFVVIDGFHHLTGISPPRLDFSQLQPNLAAFGLLVEFHYRYYQFCSNTLVAVALSYGIRLSGGCSWCGPIGWVDFGFVFVEVVLFAASRDTLRKYYVRVAEVLSSDGPAERSAVMSNGCGKEHETKKVNTRPGAAASTKKEEKRAEVSATPPKKGTKVGRP